jgi:hypothetical protein
MRYSCVRQPQELDVPVCVQHCVHIFVHKQACRLQMTWIWGERMWKPLSLSDPPSAAKEYTSEMKHLPPPQLRCLLLLVQLAWQGRQPRSLNLSLRRGSAGLHIRVGVCFSTSVFFSDPKVSHFLDPLHPIFLLR